jgi:hypothetical protein
MRGHASAVGGIYALQRFASAKSAAFGGITKSDGGRMADTKERLAAIEGVLPYRDSCAKVLLLIGITLVAEGAVALDWNLLFGDDQISSEGLRLAEKEFIRYTAKVPSEKLQIVGHPTTRYRCRIRLDAANKPTIHFC